MPTNKKKPVTFVNRTHYFDPTVTKVRNTFVSPSSYKFRQSKIEGYESRLYWQYRYCDEHNGQAFFYTLTYNDTNVPKYLGKNVFDYEDLRELLHGAFWKRLQRNYATEVKYFVGAELGDGKGKRGLHNNPHYHIIFFLSPLKGSEQHYRKISPDEFRHFIRIYWQGFDQDEGFVDFRKAHKGIVKEGKYTGLITDFRACIYCAKYVTKDVKLVKMEKNVRLYWTMKLEDEFLAEEKVKEFRNRYTNKVRISNGVGDYAIEHIDDLLNPFIKIPSKQGFKNRPISMYYYRKIFCDVLRDPNTHNNRYLLNDKGIEFKLSSLKRQLYKKTVQTTFDINQLCSDSLLYGHVLASDVNLTVPLAYKQECFINELSRLLKDKSLLQISTDYAKFKLVYQNRFYRIRTGRCTQRHFDPVLDSDADYRRFLTTCPFRFNPTPVRDFLEDHTSLYVPYESHSYFLPYSRIFAMLDNLSDYLFIKDDDKAQELAEQIANIRRFHKQLEVQPILNLIYA